MNKELLHQFLNQKGIYKKETANRKNLVCECPVCGDHTDERKRNHLYISSSKNMYNCFLNGCSGRTSRLLKQLGFTDQDVKEVFTKDELESKGTYVSGIIQKKDLTRKFRKLTLPKIEPGEFLDKRSYIKGRIDYKDEPENIPGLVFDVFKFVRDNGITIDPNLFDINFLHNNFVGFVLHNQTQMIFRCIDNNIPIKFVKIEIQEDPLELGDYYLRYGNCKDSNLIVIAEGIFSLSGEYYTDSLGLKDKANMYISTQGFDNASNVLKSICFSTNIFEFDIVFLADRDKDTYKFLKFVENCDHVIKSLNIYYNLGKNDFGQFPIHPVKGGELRDVKACRKNKKTF